MLDRTDATTEALLGAVAGQYSLEREIGRGGMGVVFLARDEQLARPVAIKTLPPHLSADPLVRARFIREARTAGGLSHPNIVPIYFAAERDSVVFFSMRYVNGLSMAERIAKEGQLDARDLIPTLLEVASALGYAHEHGIVHRDIKAENVLLDAATGRAMLTDFGIARVAETQPTTATGAVLGTVQYMSPEQVTGETLDGRSDLYALGVLAYLALSGRFPFERPTPSAILVAHVTSTPSALCTVAPNVPREVGAIVDRLLSKAPGDRYANADELRRALERALQSIIDADSKLTPVLYNDPGPPVFVPSSPDANAMTRANVNEDASASSRTAMSSTEAQQVWSRAAELQANTGMIVPPAEFRAPSQNASLTSGYDRSVVRDSAVDAGIDAKYVDRALAERDNARNVPVELQRGEAMRRKVNPLVGTGTKIEFETTLDGELDDQGFEDIVDELRRTLGEMVNISSVGRTLTITTQSSSQRGGGQRRLQIYITSRNGRTSFRAFEDLSPLAGAYFGGMMGGFGGGVGGALVGVVMENTRNGLYATCAMLGTVAVAYLGARLLFSRHARERENGLRELLQRVVARATKSTGKLLP